MRPVDFVSEGEKAYEETKAIYEKAKNAKRVYGIFESPVIIDNVASSGNPKDFNIVEYYFVRETPTLYVVAHDQHMLCAEKIKKSDLIFTERKKAFRKCISLNKKRITKLNRAIRAIEKDNKSLLEFLSEKPGVL